MQEFVRSNCPRKLVSMNSSSSLASAAVCARVVVGMVPLPSKVDDLCRMFNSNEDEDPCCGCVVCTKIKILSRVVRTERSVCLRDVHDRCVITVCMNTCGCTDDCVQ